MTPTGFRAALLPLAALLLAGCSSDPKRQIVGKWEATEDRDDVRALEFDANGGVKAYLKGDDEPVDGTYELADGKTLTHKLEPAIMKRLQERVKRRGTSTILLPPWVVGGQAEVAFTGSEMSVKTTAKTTTYKRTK
jgi:hypothetical protein